MNYLVILDLTLGEPALVMKIIAINYYLAYMDTIFPELNAALD